MKNQIMSIDVSYSDNCSVPVIVFGRILGNRIFRVDTKTRFKRVQELIDQLESINLTQSYLHWKGLTINIYRR